MFRNNDISLVDSPSFSFLKANINQLATSDFSYGWFQGAIQASYKHGEAELSAIFTELSHNPRK